MAKPTRVKDEAKTFVTRTNELPVFINNTLTLRQGESVVLTAEQLSATDIETENPALLFNATNIRHGQFDFVSFPNITISEFYQQNITEAQVRFTHDGGKKAPAYDVSVSDGMLSTGPARADIHFRVTQRPSATFPAVLELSSLNGSHGFVLNGVAVADQSGYSVSSAGDINGDGVDDLLIGAPYADPAGRPDAGAIQRDIIKGTF